MSDLDVQQLQAWSTREAAASDGLTTRAQQSAWLLWLAFSGWYAPDQVAALAQRTVTITEAGRVQAGNLGAAYMREVLAGLRATGSVVTSGRTAVKPVHLDLPDARLGADLVEVYSRPAEAYREAYALTEDTTAAAQAAQTRLGTLIAADTLIARRDGEHQQMAAAGVDHYRRIVHPELSKTGICGLCLVASDRVYTIKELLPIHDRCKCTVAPDGDAAADAVQIELARIYDDAGGTQGRKLKEVRYQVNEHGELGPVLGVKGQNFQRRGEAPKGDPVERARKELGALEPVLDSLERRSAAGEDVAGPLAYQIERVTKLRRIAAAA